MSNASADFSTLADLQLPALTSEQAPLFTTLEACKKWLTGVPITNAMEAQAQLLRQLSLLNRFSLPGDERLKIVEYLRSPTYFVHGESAKRFAARAVPLAPPEQAAFETSHALWQALEIGYLHCLQDLLDQVAKAASAGTGATLGEDARKSAALAATRALTTALAIYLDHCSAGLMPAADFWRRLHKIYFAAEKLGVTQLAVADKLGHATSVTALASYLEPLLLAATQPHELRSRQLAQVTYWAHRWATKVPLLREPPEDLRTPPLCIDLASEQAATFQSPRVGATLRWLNLAELRKTIKQRLIKLGQGVSPEELKLGKDCVQPACELLLRQVYIDWCKGGRTPIGDGGKAYQVLGSIDAIHYHLSGEIFRPPEKSIYLNKREYEEIATFGHIATRFEEDKKLQHSYIVEDWQSLEEDIVDIRMQRPLNQPGSRLTLDQLVALRAQGDAAYQLGKLTWASVDGPRTTLLASIHLLPGAPTAVIVHNPGTSAVKSQYSRGFCLPAIEGLNQVDSVLTPNGWFRADHIIEIKTDSMQKVRLTRLIERGADFDRCAYEIL